MMNFQPREAGEGLPPLSVLELATVQEGTSAGDALAAVTVVAGYAEELGFQRIWLAEHHGYRSVGSVAPAVLAAHLAAVTRRIRLGSGGILLPHHAPLAVAEQFETLSALYPGRIDLGIGRGPGTTDERVIRALRGAADAGLDDTYRADVAELLGYLGDGESALPLPGRGLPPEPWLLSSSVTGAELAAQLGLPLAFGHHIRPANTVAALTRYRDRFRPSRWRQEPYVMVSVETLCAPTDVEAQELGKPAALTMAAALQGRGAAASLLPADQAARERLPPEIADRLAALRGTQAHGSPRSVLTQLSRLVTETAADELMLSTPVYEPADRARSLELVMTAARRASVA